MILRKVLEREQKRLNVDWLVLEQDYILSWILFGISCVDDLRENLIFKGGTALKKIYFGDYRFSQDLDFTCLEGAPHGAALEKMLLEACSIAQHELSTRIPNPVIECFRYLEKQPHPHGQEAFVIRAQLPWHKSPYVRVMVEATRNQHIVNPPVIKNVIHGYPEDYVATIFAYTLDEIFGEKLLAMLQNAKKLHERRWSRSRVRDYYDLWRMLRDRRNLLSPELVLKAFFLKNANIVVYDGLDDFFDPLALKGVERDWNEWLFSMIYPLPSYDVVISELQEQLGSFFSATRLESSQFIALTPPGDSQRRLEI